MDLPYEPMLAAKGSFEHYMLKEIMEQPDSVLSTIRGRVRFDPAEIELEGVHLSGRELNGIKRVLLVGMGTSPTCRNGRSALHGKDRWAAC